MSDFPLNFTVGVRTFPILLTKCPESQGTTIRHFCYQSMKTPIDLLLSPIIVAYLLLPLPPAFGQFSFHPFLVSSGPEGHLIVVHSFIMAHPGTLTSGGRAGLVRRLG